MDDWIQPVLLGIIEGITEFLPVSSTGHLLITEHWLGKRSDLFNIFIQGGAVLAVLLIYRKRLLGMMFNWKQPEHRSYLAKLLFSFGITGALGLVVSKCGLKLPESVTPVAWATLIGGFVIFGGEYYLRHHLPEPEITWHIALWVALAQILAAIFPGTSRSGASILAAMLVGASRFAATEFSFLVGIPTLIAASFFSLWKARHALASASLQEWGDLGIGFAVSTLTAFIVVRWLLAYVRSRDFTPFAWYRCILGITLLLWA